MAGETIVTITGNLIEDPELRFTPSGAAVAKFRVASVPRKFDKNTNQWEDDKEKALYLSCSVWRQQAEHVAESCVKGMRVVVQGRLTQRSYEDREGVKRTVFELEADEVAVSLKMATARVEKAKGGGREAFQQARQKQGAEDPWASSAPAGSGGGGWGGRGGDEPPPF